MNGYKGNDQLLRQQSSTKAHEAQLLDARRQRKETDEQFQAMMNRIAFLAQEELRLDRDIEAARRRAAEALARQATRDQEIAATAKEVLAVMPAAAPPKLVRPHTGRSSLFASLSEGASTSAPASGPPSLRASAIATATASQHSIRSLDSGPSASPTASIPAPGGLGPGPTGGASCGPGAGPGPGSGHPPRAPSASRGRPPVPAGRAADKAGKLPPVAPGSGTAMIRSPSPSGGARPSSASRPSTAASGGGGRSRASSTSPTSSSISGFTSARRFSTDASAAAPPSASPTSPPPPPRSGRKAADDGGLTVHPSGLTHITGMHQLPGGPPPHGAADLFPGSELPPVLGAAGSGPLSARNTMTHVHGGELAAVDLPSGLGGGGGAAAFGRNAMTVIHGGTAAAAVGELDGEVVEELTQGSRSAAAAALGGPSGLQEFATESGRRVVLVKASRKTEGTTVSAAGVGWGMGGRGAGGATSIAPKEARQLQAELAKKQQIWKVRKTFGLEPTPMSDRSAQVEEVGAGAWQ